MTTRTMSSFPAVAGRLFWMFVGPFALAVSAIGIAGRRDGWLGPSDVFYFVVLAGMLVGRWTEFRSGAAHDGDRRARHGPGPAPIYLGIGVLGLGVWVAAHLIGHRGAGLLG